MLMIIRVGDIRDLNSDRTIQFLLSFLPHKLISRFDSQGNKEKRLKFLAGRYLLFKALIELDELIDNVNFDGYDRPYLKNAPIDFNISYSSNLVLLALVKHGRVGIDIETICDINLDNFKSAMSEAQWQAIITSTDPIQEFYRLWTIRESVVKADGRGLAIPMSDIDIDTGLAHCMGKRWYTCPVELGPSYMAHLAWDYPIVKIDLKKISLAGNQVY